MSYIALINELKTEVSAASKLNSVFIGETASVESLPVAMIMPTSSTTKKKTTSSATTKRFQRSYMFTIKILDNYNQGIDRSTQEVDFLEAVEEVDLILDKWISSVPDVYRTEKISTNFGYGQLASGQARLCEITIVAEKLHKINP